jgi:prevent-host-death family protein
MKAALPEPEIVTRKGKPVSVIIPIKDYEEQRWTPKTRPQVKTGISHLI